MQSKHLQKRKVSLLLAICLLCSLCIPAAAVGAAAGGYAETYGINVPFTPSARTSRYTFAVYEGDTVNLARLLVQKELSLSAPETVFLPIPSFLSTPSSYILAVTAHPMPGREGLDSAATKTAPFRLEPTCGHPGASGAFLMGDGSAQSPYLIANAAQLDHLRQHTDAYVRQVCDIDMAGIDWQPFDFNGTYDGNGYMLQNLNVSCANRHVGLFSILSGTLMNLGIEDANIILTSGSYYAAVFAGRAQDAFILRCYSKNCIVDNVSFATGSIIGDDGPNVLIEDCYETGGVYTSANRYAGGIAGDFSGDSTSNTIRRCYAIPSKLTSAWGNGMLVGYWLQARAEDCYFPSDTSCGSTTATASGNVSGAVGIPLASFPNAASFSGWNIGADSSAWVMGDSVPELKIFAEHRARDYSLPQGASARGTSFSLPS